MFLNLDKKFQPFGVNKEIIFDSFTFPGGEPHIRISSDLVDVNEVTITHRIQSFNDFGLLLLAVDALKNMQVEYINLFIPYFPAARQDRLMTTGEALSVKVYAELINNLKLKSVTVFDPHSKVAPSLINNCEVVTNHEFIKRVVGRFDEKIVLISPDAGSLKKINQLSEFLDNKYEVIECSKSRDPKTGRISKFDVPVKDLKGKDCLIVDDICDGGSTFLGLAKELKNKNVGKLYLAVSHGIFSKGFVELDKYFDKIFATNSFQDYDGESVVQIKLNEIV